MHVLGETPNLNSMWPVHSLVVLSLALPIKSSRYSTRSLSPRSAPWEWSDTLANPSHSGHLCSLANTQYSLIQASIEPMFEGSLAASLVVVTWFFTWFPCCHACMHTLRFLLHVAAFHLHSLEVFLTLVLQEFAAFTHAFRLFSMDARLCG